MVVPVSRCLARRFQAFTFLTPKSIGSTAWRVAMESVKYHVHSLILLSDGKKIDDEVYCCEYCIGAETKHADLGPLHASVSRSSRGNSTLLEK